MLSLVIALLSILTVAVPVVLTMWTPKNSDLVFTLHGSTEENIYVLVSNQGIRPGSFRSGSLEVTNGGTLGLHIFGLAKNAPKIIDPGKSEIIPLYSEFVYESISPEIDICSLGFIDINFQGTQEKRKISVDCGQVREFIWEHKKPRRTTSWNGE